MVHRHHMRLSGTVTEIWRLKCWTDERTDTQLILYSVQCYACIGQTIMINNHKNMTNARSEFSQQYVKLQHGHAFYSTFTFTNFPQCKLLLFLPRSDADTTHWTQKIYPAVAVIPTLFQMQPLPTALSGCCSLINLPYAYLWRMVH